MPEARHHAPPAEWLTIDWPSTTTSSATLRWPVKPTWPLIMQLRPIVVLPEMPVQAAIAVCAPMRTLCPTWI